SDPIDLVLHMGTSSADRVTASKRRYWALTAATRTVRRSHLYYEHVDHLRICAVAAAGAHAAPARRDHLRPHLPARDLSLLGRGRTDRCGDRPDVADAARRNLRRLSRMRRVAQGLFGTDL